MAHQSNALTTSLTRQGQLNSAGDTCPLFKIVQWEMFRLPARDNRS